MNKLIIAVIVIIILAFVVSYFWNNTNAPTSSEPQADSFSSEDQAIAQELEAIESLNVDNEFQEIDTSLNQL